jgi:hypothetical protein
MANMKEAQKQAIAELYVKLLPYLMKDFYYKADVDAVLRDHNIESDTVDFYAKQRLAALQTSLDNGEEAYDLIEPLVALDLD